MNLIKGYMARYKYTNMLSVFWAILSVICGLLGYIILSKIIVALINGTDTFDPFLRFGLYLFTFLITEGAVRSLLHLCLPQSDLQNAEADQRDACTEALQNAARKCDEHSFR